jgi:ABC-type transport system involved in multi-copper enzyme maturation permease subunit
VSAQTGEEVPSGPASTRAVDRARFRVALWSRDPNPIWIRELRQSARLGRTPIILMIVTVLMTLVIASLGGVMSSESAGDRVGVAVYHTYFSLAFFLVTWLGPAVAANSIASEREGRTWEAVLLTGLPPAVVARGKFLAAMTSISTYIVMLAPVGALAFLFGGVTATEVLIAFAYLFLFALLFVALGLAVSSKMSSLRASILVTLLVCVPLSFFCFGALGLGLSEGIHELWRQVPRKLPVWLPTAYVRGEMGAPYILILVVMPIVVLGVPTWFLYESVIANLKGHNEDRSTALKRWFAISTVVLGATAVACVRVVTPSGAVPVGIMGLAVLAMFLALTVLVFAGEPVGPSRRVRLEWARDKRGALGRFFGPSAVRAGILTLVVGSVVTAAFAAIGAHTIAQSGEPMASLDVVGFWRLVLYALGFFSFLVGFTSYVRVRVSTPLVTRMIVLGVLAFVSIVPWVIAAIAGALSHGMEEGIVIAAPSPFFALYMYDEARHALTDPGGVEAGFACIAAWTAGGVVLLTAAAARTRKLVEESERSVAETDRRLALEDAEREAYEAAQASAGTAAGGGADDHGGSEPGPDAETARVDEATAAAEPARSEDGDAASATGGDDVHGDAPRED